MTDIVSRQIQGVAEILAATEPDAWPRLRADHVADHSGHCRACRPSSGASPVWPCSLRAIADEAARISAAGRDTAVSDRGQVDPIGRAARRQVRCRWRV